MIVATTRDGRRFVVTDAPDADVEKTATWVARQEAEGIQWLPVFRHGTQAGMFRVADVLLLERKRSWRERVGLSRRSDTATMPVVAESQFPRPTMEEIGASVPPEPNQDQAIRTALETLGASVADEARAIGGLLLNEPFVAAEIPEPVVIGETSIIGGNNGG